MAPGHNFVIDELGATALENLELDDIDDPDSLSALDPDKSQLVFRSLPTQHTLTRTQNSVLPQRQSSRALVS
jgi:hypothetical protein